MTEIPTATNDSVLVEAIAAAIFKARQYDGWYPSGFANAPGGLRAMCLRDADVALTVVRESDESEVARP